MPGSIDPLCESRLPVAWPLPILFLARVLRSTRLVGFGGGGWVPLDQAVGDAVSR
jgi:hypothetical protein